MEKDFPDSDKAFWIFSFLVFGYGALFILAFIGTILLVLGVV
jgi:hypothetical protein